MSNIRYYKKFISVLLAGILALSSTVFCYADNTSDISTNESSNSIEDSVIDEFSTGMSSVINMLSDGSYVMIKGQRFSFGTTDLISENENIAATYGFFNKKVKAVENGETTLTINGIPHKLIIITPNFENDNINLPIGDNVQLNLLNVPDGVYVSWVSRNPDVASVGDGIVYGHKSGNTVVSAYINGMRIDANVTVNASNGLNYSDVYLKTGEFIDATWMDDVSTEGCEFIEYNDGKVKALDQAGLDTVSANGSIVNIYVEKRNLITDDMLILNDSGEYSINLSRNQVYDIKFESVFHDAVWTSSDMYSCPVNEHGQILGWRSGKSIVKGTLSGDEFIINVTVVGGSESDVIGPVIEQNKDAATDSSVQVMVGNTIFNIPYDSNYIANSGYFPVNSNKEKISVYFFSERRNGKNTLKTIDISCIPLPHAIYNNEQLMIIRDPEGMNYFDINLDAGEGSFSDFRRSKTVKAIDGYPAYLPKPTKPGAYFRGWIENGNLFDDLEPITSNHTLYAVYTDTIDEDIPDIVSKGEYTVRLNNNVEHIKATEGFGNYNEGSIVALNITPEDGYFISFVGSDNVGVKSLGNNNYGFTMPSSDVVIRVQTKENSSNTFSVTADEVTQGIKSIEGLGKYKSGDAVVLSVITEDGYGIPEIGASNCDIDKLDDTKYSFIMPSENVSLHIKATNNKAMHKVMLDGNNVSVSGLGEYREGDKVNIVLNITDGYQINDIYSDNVELNKINDNEYSFTMPNEDVTVKTSSQAINYDIAYDLDGGKVTGNPSTYNIETETFSLIAPQKDKSKFLGWIGSNGVTPKLEVEIAKGSYGDLSFKAVWETNGYDIVYHANGGTLSDSVPVEYTSGVKTLLPSSDDISKKGYAFGGWYDNEGLNGQSISQISENESGNRQFYARWNLLTYSISYNLGGGTLSGNNPSEYTVLSDDFDLLQPVSDNSIFIGWTGSNGNSPELNVTIKKGQYAEPLSFNANWEGKLNAEITPPSPIAGLVYNGRSQKLVSSGIAYNGCTMEYRLDDGEWGAGIPSAVDAGSYSVHYRAKGNHLYNNSEDGTVIVSIEKAVPDIDISVIDNLVYNGNAQELIEADAPLGCTVTFRMNEVPFTERIPTATNAGNYDVYYKTNETKNYEGIPETKLDAVIHKAKTIATTPRINSLVYTGKDLFLINPEYSDDGSYEYGLDTAQMSSDVPKAKDAGLYKVYYRIVGDSNHENSDFGNVTVNINKALGDLIEPVPRRGLIYNGSSQTLIHEGNSEDGTVMYKFADDNEDSYSDEIPSATDAGVYVIDYKVKGDNNHLDTNKQSLEVRVYNAAGLYDDDWNIIKTWDDLVNMGLDITQNYEDAPYYGDPGPDCYLSHSSSGYSILKNNSLSGNLVLTDDITDIGNYAFAGCTGIKSVVVPNGVENVGKGSFKNDIAMKSLELSDSIIDIGDNAFAYTSIRKLDIPGVVQNCGAACFSYCNYLTSVNMQDGVSNIGNNMFYSDNSLYSVNIPDSVEDIGWSAFYSCASLEEIELPKGIHDIKPYTFSYCSSLKGIEIPYGVNSIENNVFYKCTNIKKVDIPKSVVSIKESAFRDCHNLEDVSLPNDLIELGQYAFYNCGSIDLIKIPGSIKMVPDDCLGCDSSYGKGPKEIIFEEGVEELDYGVSRNNGRLENAVFPSTLRIVKDYAFHYCTNLNDISIPGEIEQMGEYAFGYCDSIKSAYIKCNHAVIHKSFNYSKGIETVVFEGPMDSISYAFSNCSNLRSIKGLSAKKMEEMTNMFNLQELEIVEGAEEISPFNVYGGSSPCFTNCKITKLTLPNSLKFIGPGCFRDSIIADDAIIDDNNNKILQHGTEGNVDIVFGNNLEYIGDSSFSGCCGIKSVTIGKGMENICQEAFSNCSNIEHIEVVSENSVYDSRDNCNAIINSSDNNLVLGCANTVIPESVTSIGYGAFAGNEGLTSLHIPKNVTSICLSGIPSFYECNNLNSITVDEGNTVYDSRDNCNAIIQSSNNELVLACNNSSIPDSVEKFNNYAFYGAKNLESLYIPANITNLNIGISYDGSIISNDMFKNCISLTSIIVSPENSTFDSRNNCNLIIKKSNDSVVKGCSNSTIPEGVKLIYPSAFANISTPFELTLPSSMIKIYKESFKNCTGLKSINLNDELTQIGEEAFNNCGIQEITLSSSLTNVERAAFADNDYLVKAVINCNISNSSIFLRDKSLKEVIFSDDITTVGSYMFESCSSLDNVKLSESLQSISNGMFSYCNSLSECNIPNSVTNIKDYAFEGSNLKTIDIPVNVNTIGRNAFEDCKNLETVNIYGSLANKLEDDIFSGCDNLRSAYLSDNVKNIDNLFKRVSSLKEVRLPSNIETIGEDAFYDCNNLESIEIPNSVEKIDNTAFYNCGSLKTINLPNNVTYIGRSSFNGCTGVSDIVVPDVCGEIGNNAFYGVKHITYHGSYTNNSPWGALSLN